MSPISKTLSEFYNGSFFYGSSPSSAAHTKCSGGTRQNSGHVPSVSYHYAPEHGGEAPPNPGALDRAGQGGYSVNHQGH